MVMNKSAIKGGRLYSERQKTTPAVSRSLRDRRIKTKREPVRKSSTAASDFMRTCVLFWLDYFIAERVDREISLSV